RRADNRRAAARAQCPEGWLSRSFHMAGRRPPQIEREWEIGIEIFDGRIDGSARMSDCEEARKPPALGFVCIHRKRFEGSATRMRHMIHAAPHRAPIPRI